MILCMVDDFSSLFCVFFPAPLFSSFIKKASCFEPWFTVCGMFFCGATFGSEAMRCDGSCYGRCATAFASLRLGCEGAPTWQSPWMAASKRRAPCMLWQVVDRQTMINQPKKHKKARRFKRSQMCGFVFSVVMVVWWCSEMRLSRLHSEKHLAPAIGLQCTCRSLQVSGADEHLIHLGPVSKPKSWHGHSRLFHLVADGEGCRERVDVDGSRGH